MPGSSSAGRVEAMEMLLKLDPEPQSILDVGPGAGQWFDLLKPWFSGVPFNAIEIFEPYVERYKLRERYDKVMLGDVRDLVYQNSHSLSVFYWDLVILFYWDLVIFGDVIEHMPKPDAIQVVKNLLHKHALISIPIGPCPQDPTDENPYEEHVAEWSTDDVLDTFNNDWCQVIGCHSYQYPPPHYGRGVFLLEKKHG